MPLHRRSLTTGTQLPAAMAVLDSWPSVVEHIQNGANAAVSSLASQAAVMPSSIPSVRTLSKLAFSGAQVLLGGGQGVLGGPSESCPNAQLSCHNTTVVENLCCFNAPGGQILQTQFWDTQPVTGPVDSWTLHGLWYVLVSYCWTCETQLVYCERRKANSLNC